MKTRTPELGVIVEASRDGQKETWLVVGTWRNAFDAASNAGLAVMHRAGGIATPLFVIHGADAVNACDGSCFDAEDFDDVVTFAGVDAIEPLAIPT